MTEENNEKATHKTIAVLEKYDSEEDYRGGAEPNERVELPDNALLDAGITEIWNQLIGGGGSAYSNANARVGVGNSTTSVDPSTQTGLVGGSTAFGGMESGYPDVSGTSITFRAVFGDADANFDWNEWVVDNGTTAINRRQVAMGTKSGGTWTLTVTITLT